MEAPSDAKELIAALNDRVRREPRPGEILTTPGIRFFGRHATAWLLDALARYDKFDEGDNPYGERDFGAIEFRGQKIFWKIDYYNLTLNGGSEAPWDETRCRRVLTLMLASEY